MPIARSKFDSAAAGLSFSYLDETEHDALPEILAAFPDDPVSEVDETWDYMVELLEANEIDFPEFRRQMLSAGYSDEQIATAVKDAE